MNKIEIEEIVRKEIVQSVLKTQDFLVVGNWKMNKTKREVNEFLDEISKADLGTKNTIVIIPPSPYLYLFESKLRYSRVFYGVQNFYPKENGAFTGEISITMARDFGSKYSIIGHSERRNIFNECNDLSAKKVLSSIKNQMKPILCIGESLIQREKEDYKSFLKTQIKEGLSLLDESQRFKVIIAYEPIWAIGTGVTATPSQVEEVHMFLRNYLIDEYGFETGRKIPLLYGGSVSAENVKELALAQSVSGFLIGGASLSAKTLTQINDILNGK